MNIDMAREWLKASAIDLDSISYIIKVEHLTSIVAFHSQQSIEKSLKALLEFYNMDIPKIHSLNKLFKILENYFRLDEYTIINKLDKFYIDSRYPGNFGLLPYGNPTLKDAKEFYDFANNIFDKVCNILDINKQELL